MAKAEYVIEKGGQDSWPPETGPKGEDEEIDSHNHAPGGVPGPHEGPPCAYFIAGLVRATLINPLNHGTRHLNLNIELLCGAFFDLFPNLQPFKLGGAGVIDPISVKKRGQAAIVHIVKTEVDETLQSRILREI